MHSLRLRSKFAFVETFCIVSSISHSQSDETALSSPDSPSPESPDLLKKGIQASRSANAFIFYRKHHHSDTVARNLVFTTMKSVTRIIGKMWCDESEPVKKQWKDQAESVKRQHIRYHPGYQYQPRKPHEKKRCMTKRKAIALPLSSTIKTFSPVAPTVGPFSSVTSPSQIVDLSNYDDPLLGYSSNGDLASFTLDTFESNQLDLFSNLLEEHNIDYEYGPASLLAPGASTSLPTTLNHAMADGNNGASLIDPNLTANDLTMAQTDLKTFESSLEDMLARELENMDGDGADSADNGFQYNDLESLRFTEFLEQMPEHMWGMEFVN
ncbi:hypothetical protein D6D12_05082 [Aureobasidium pullulans]|uniref:HMG box domain-containing protein n=1 Tax=Aureobasidium pullulans TaxID=5580 RepID=A0AB74JUT7_AURPU|nr:hypothetical protein D6D12_05082 [Aureobasidium pullulans]